jgi:hypothetical protein
VSAHVRETLARLSVRPPGEWARRLEQEFPDDMQMRTQALLWLHCERDHTRHQPEALSVVVELAGEYDTKDG